MVERLSDGPMSVSRLAEPFAMTLSAVAQHLRVLEDCGLVQTAKSGRVRTCRLDPAGIATIEQWARDRRSLWEQRIDRLGDLLDED